MRGRVSLGGEEFLRMLHGCGMPAADADMVHGSGKTVGGLLMQVRPCSAALPYPIPVTEARLVGGLLMQARPCCCLGTQTKRSAAGSLRRSFHCTPEMHGHCLIA